MMDLCEKWEILRTLPKPKKPILWTLKIKNGTLLRITERFHGSSSNTSNCYIEIANIVVALITILLTIIFIFKYKCTNYRKSYNSFLPLHSIRSVLCLLLLLISISELCETLLLSISLSSIAIIVAIFASWILHRDIELRNNFGTALTSGGFAALGIARACTFFFLYRHDLSLQHLRVFTTACTSVICGLLAILDSYTVYQVWKKHQLHRIDTSENKYEAYKYSTSTFLSRITFYWVVELLLKSYRNSISLKDLGSLPEKETTKTQYNEFHAIYIKEKTKNQQGEVSLWRCYWKKIWFGLILGGILKLFGDMLTLVGPITISKIIDFSIMSQNVTLRDQQYVGKSALTIPEVFNNGYVLGLLVLFALLLQSTLSQASTHILCVQGIRLKISLQALIFEKTLRLCSFNITEEEKDTSSHHHQFGDIGTLTNLITSDVYNVMSFFWIGHYIWAIPLKISGIVFLLYTKLGISAIIGTMCCILIVTPLQLILGKYMSENSKAINGKSDVRLKLINETLQGIKIIKLRTWESIFEKRVQRTREQELRLLDRDSIYWALISFITHASSILTTLITFWIHSLMENPVLTEGDVFTALALFSQLTVPLLIFPVMVPTIINAVISTTRIEEFLHLQEITNIIPNLSDRKLNIIRYLKVNDNLNTDKNLQDKNDNQYSSGSILSVASCTFSLESNENQLYIEHLSIPRGKLSIVVGKTGSGKTTLLLAILGEITKLYGDIEWSRNVRIAYVAQKPWLLNGTLRNNILFGSAYKPKSYSNVLRACALEPDIDALPDRDLTKVGEKGVNLSGGQKQRVAIARAIYSNANVVIMDDPLSALDARVSQHIFENAIKKFLLQENRTVIMVTHRKELLSAADQVVLIEDRRIRFIGNESDIVKLNPVLIREWGFMDISERNECRPRISAENGCSSLNRIDKKSDLVDRAWMPNQDTHMPPTPFIPLRRLKSILCSSRYLTHDPTEIPAASEEWKLATRRLKRHRSDEGSNSSDHSKSQYIVHRQYSNSMVSEKKRIVPRKRYHTVDIEQNRRVLEQLFPDRKINPNVENNRIKNDENYKNSIPSHSLKLHKDCEKRSTGTVVSVKLDSSDGKTNGNDQDESHNAEEFDDNTNDVINKNVWLAYIKAGGLMPGLIYIVATLSCQVLRVYTDLLLSKWTNRENKSTKSYFNEYIYLSLAIIFLSLLYNVASQWAGSKARRKLHQQAICGLLKTPISFFESNPIGKILNRFSTNVGIIDKKISTSIHQLTSLILINASAIMVNVIISPWFLIPVIPICLAYYFLQKFHRRNAQQLLKLDANTRGSIGAHFTEIITGLPTLRAFKKQRHFMEGAMQHIDSNTNVFLLLNTSSRWLGIALDYLGAFVVFAVIYTALLSAEFCPDRVTPALVGLTINYTLLVPIYLNWVVKFTAEVEMYMKSVALVSAYEKLPKEDNRDDALIVPKDWPSKGEIIFDKVSLLYESQKNPIVRDLSLKIPSGQKLGICGRTGSGKSSTVMALFQVIKVCQGRIMIDGIDIQQVPLYVLRSSISIIPQDVIMFSGTLRENLDPLSEHKDEELWNALELVHMKDIIVTSSQGLDYEVSEGGENLSVGQLQLLSMARAVLKRSSIIVFDEATSALDIMTEKAVLDAASTVFKDKTLIHIAHRAAALLDSDKVIVFDKGQIVEEGTPQELMYRSNGFFASLLEAFEQNDDKR